MMWLFYQLAMVFGSVLLSCGFWVRSAYAEWAPLIDAGAFTGIQADVSTAVAGIVTIALIILGAALLMRAIK